MFPGKSLSESNSHQQLRPKFQQIGKGQLNYKNASRIDIELDFDEKKIFVRTRYMSWHRPEGFDQIRLHSFRSLQFDQKVRPLSFRPEKFDLFTATRRISPISSSAPRPLRAAYVPILLSEVEQEQRPSGNGDREAIVVGAGLCDGEGERAYTVYDSILDGEKYLKYFLNLKF